MNRASMQGWWSAVFMIVALLAATGSFGEGKASTDARKQCRLLLKVVRTHMEADRPDSAVVYARQAIECDPGQADSYWYLAHAQLALGEPSQARQTLDEGTAAAPMSQRLALFRARVCLESGETGPAREAVEKVMILPMHRAEALYLLGSIELAEGDSLGAMDSWRAALREALGEGGGE